MEHLKQLFEKRKNPSLKRGSQRTAAHWDRRRALLNHLLRNL